MKTAGDKERDRFGGYLPIVGVAIRHKDTGEITRGADHEGCRVSAYRIATGDTRTAKEIRKARDGVSVLDVWLCDQPFEDGFCNEIGMFFDRTTATQIVCKRMCKPDGKNSSVTQMTTKAILAVGYGIYRSGGALPPDNKVEKVYVEDEW